MKNNIREKRKLFFNKKRITPQIIRQFAELIDEQVRHLTDHFFLLYSIDANDDTSYESQSLQLFKENGLIERRLIKKVVMRFNMLDGSKNIEIQIMESEENAERENFILVSGDDANWVNGILARLEDVLAHAESQPKQTWIIGWGMFAAWLLFIIEFFRLTYGFMTAENTSDFLGVLLFIGVPIVSGYLAAQIYNYLYGMYPAVELQTGPNYMQISNNNRRRSTWILASIVVPLVLAVFYDLVKSFILNS